MDIEWLIALGICIAAAGIETLCAGRDPMVQLSALKQPHWSPPNWLRVLIGLAWYGICFTGLVRLLPLWPESRVPVLLLVGLLLGNAALNIPLFRTRQLGIALACFIPYWMLLAAFFWAVYPLDRLTFAPFAAYAVYQIYAAAWGYALWHRNRVPDQTFPRQS